MSKSVFNVDGYVSDQYNMISEQIRQFGKLYLELGGKLFDDYHASRVIPGFLPDTKLRIIDKLKDDAEIIICINSNNIQNDRIRSDYNTLYVNDCLKLIDTYRKLGFYVSGVVFTLFNGQEKAVEFKKFLENNNENVYVSRFIQNYPNDHQAAIEAFKESDYIKTTRPLVVMSSSGSASGKLSACLCQVYNEYLAGNNVGYSKLDVFPVWNYPVNHPLNLAFMAATADSEDKIIIDSYYKEKYGVEVSNYNRDLSVFPLIYKILTIANGGKEMYSSPTEMVFNPLKKHILDESVVESKCKEEVCRRLFTYMKQFSRGDSKWYPVENVSKIMKENGITTSDLKVIDYARDYFAQNQDKKLGVLQLENGLLYFIEEKNNKSMEVELLYAILKSIEKDDLINKNLSFDEILQVLKENNLFGYLCECLSNANFHTSYCISKETEMKIKQLGINVTCESENEKSKIKTEV